MRQQQAHRLAGIVTAHKHARRVHSDGQPAGYFVAVKAGGDHGVACQVLQVAKPACSQAEEEKRGLKKVFTQQAT